MDWRGYRKLTLLFVVLSIITDATIVAFDGYVPRGTLTNLEGVIAVYVILVVLLLARPSWGLTITLVLSALWLLAQLGNAFFSSAPPGFTFPKDSRPTYSDTVQSHRTQLSDAHMAVHPSAILLSLQSYFRFQ